MITLKVDSITINRNKQWAQYYEFKKWGIFSSIYYMLNIISILCFIIANNFFVSDPDRMSALLSSSIFEAHTRTCILSGEQIQECCRTGVDPNKVFAFKTMVRYYTLLLNQMLISLTFHKQIFCLQVFAQCWCA